MPLNDQSIINLREYQINARDAALKAWQERKLTRLLIQLPTGTGKTIVFASLAKKLKTRTLIIAHRDELIRQAQDKIGMVWPEAKTGIVKASENDFEGRDVVIASIQSLAREKRLNQLTGQDFGLCIIDECFVAGTLVDGRPIESILVGDYVTAWDERNKQFVQAKVTRIFKHKVHNGLIKINASGIEIICTPNHPILANEEWHQASELKTGDILIKYFNGDIDNENIEIQQFIRVDSVEILEQGSNREFERMCPDGYVYNLEIEEFHTYTANGIVVHNCHHACAKTYRDTIGALGFMDDDPSKLLLGVTATTRRLDKLGLKNVFQEIVFERTILTMIKGGYLSDIRGYRTNTNIDLITVKTAGGDFVEAELSVMINTPERNQRVIESYLEHAQGRKAIAFTAGIQHAVDLSEMFNKHNIISKSISGKTTDDERKKILKEFAKGKIKIICNCNILTEGYDEPSIDCILMARPTKSSSLYTQMVGRGTRKYPGKSNCIVIDFTDKAHNICALPDLLGKEIEDGESILEIEEREEKEKRNKNAKRKDIGSIAEFDILGKSIFRWTFYGTDWRLPVGVGEYVSIKPCLTGLSDITLYNIFIIRKGEKDNLIYNSPLDLSYAQGIGEDYARKNGLAFASKKAKWRQNPSPTEKQIEWLKKFKIFREGITRGEASDALDDFFAKKAREKIN